MFGWGWFGKWFRNEPRAMDREHMEERMKKEGMMKADGTISVDRDFDPELNAMMRDMNADDADADASLQAAPDER